MSETIYRVAAKNAVLANRGTKTYEAGDIVPVREIWANQPGRLEEMLKLGIVTTGEVVVQERNGPRESGVVIGKWRVSPADLAGKDLEALHLMILEIDVSMHTELPETEEEARAFLSIDYHPDPD